MRRILAMILSAALILVLFGCSNSLSDEVSFYYCRNQYLFGEKDGVIAPDKRDIAGHRDDLNYLISLYFAGPAIDGLKTPFPAYTKLVDTEQIEEEVIITISDLNNISDARFSLCCACLAMTCQEITGCDRITIVSGQRTITIRPDSLTLFDSNQAAITATEEP